jgi:hypothetical protein
MMPADCDSFVPDIPQNITRMPPDGGSWPCKNCGKPAHTHTMAAIMPRRAPGKKPACSACGLSVAYRGVEYATPGPDGQPIRVVFFACTNCLGRVLNGEELTVRVANPATGEAFEFKWRSESSDAERR